MQLVLLGLMLLLIIIVTAAAPITIFQLPLLANGYILLLTLCYSAVAAIVGEFVELAVLLGANLFKQPLQ